MRRPDFLDGLGVFVGPSDVSLAAVSKRLFQVRLVEARTVPLPARQQAAERREALVAAVRAFVHDHEAEASQAVLCVPRAELAVTRVLLPAAAQENLAQVLEYEMENLVPLPRDEVYFDYAVRPLGAERIEVLIVCAPRVVIRGYLDALEEAGIRPRSIGFASTALADYVAFARGAAGPTGLVVATDDATELALFVDGRIVASQLLPIARAADGDAVARALARQQADELVDPEATRLFRWSFCGNGTPDLPGMQEEDLRQLARGQLTASEDFFTSATPSLLPAVGAALAAVREGVVRLNLLPEENRQAFDEGPSITTWVLLATSVVLLLVWGTSAIVKDVVLLRQLRARIEQVAPDVREVKTIQGDIDELQRQVEILGSGQEGRVTTLFKDLTELIPADAYLMTLNLRGGRLTLDGQARSASDLITALEKSKRFKNVTFGSPTTRQGDKERFAITAEVVK